ncbi:PrgI family protein [Candidatus Uhrbacteria bacterium]|jgi:hypothetical protein|nr:PrgI family protein [Candidatus Uhrbacteria bacterium]
MPEQFVVPQFIDAEDKIFGPVTARQFIIMISVGLTEFLLFKLFSFLVFLALGIPFLIVGGGIAFLRVNGQPFHYFMLNGVQTLRKPRLRVWNKVYTDSVLKSYMKSEPPPPSTAFHRKKFTSGSRLQEISLVVNTGGVYVPED